MDKIVFDFLYLRFIVLNNKSVYHIKCENLNKVGNENYNKIKNQLF